MASNNTLASLVVELKANSATLAADMQKARRVVETSMFQMQGALSKLQAGFGLVSRAAGGFVGGLAVGQIAEFAMKNLEAAGALGEMAEQLGVSTDLLQSLQYAATQTGVSTEQLEAGLGKFSQKVGDAAAGSHEAIVAFRAMGVGILDANNNLRPTEAILLDVATSLSAIDDPARRAAAVVDLFGKSGQKLLPLLSGGATGMRKFIDEAKAMGLVIGEDTIKKADDVSDSFARIGHVASKTAQQLSTYLIPTLKLVAKDLEALAGIETAEQHLDRLQRRVAGLQSQNFGGGKALPDQLKAARRELELYQEQLADSARNQGRLSLGGPAVGSTNNPQSKKELEEQARDAENAAKAYDKLIRGIVAEREALQGTSDTAAIVNATKGLSIALSTQQYDRLVAEVQATDALNRSREAGNAVAAQMLGEAKKQDAAREQAAKALRDQENAGIAFRLGLDDEIAKNRELAAALGISRDAYERLQIEQQILADARSRGIVMGETEAAEYANTLFAQRKAIDDVTSAQDELKAAGMDMFHVIGGAAEDALVQWENWRTFAVSALQDFERILLRLAVTKPLENALAGALGGVGGSAGGLLGWLGLSGGSTMSASTANAFYNPTGYAEGTASAAPGWHMVGERGPELVNFGKGGGTVLTSGQTADALAGGGDVHVHLTVQTGVQQTVRAEIATMLPQIAGAVAGAVADKRQRGGRFSRAMGA